MMTWSIISFPFQQICQFPGNLDLQKAELYRRPFPVMMNKSIRVNYRKISSNRSFLHYTVRAGGLEVFKSSLVFGLLVIHV